MSMDRDDNNRDDNQSRERKVYRPETGAKKVIVSHRGGAHLIRHHNAVKSSVSVRLAQPSREGKAFKDHK